MDLILCCKNSTVSSHPFWQAVAVSGNAIRGWHCAHNLKLRAERYYGAAKMMNDPPTGDIPLTFGTRSLTQY